jgi:DHA1 family bicyclomycin/chloramphenicol resistance-like MFS transporter
MTSVTRVKATRPDIRLPEFVALMALMTSLVALSMDAMLPAMPAIAADLGITDIAQTHMIITFLVLGMAFGQLFYGPLSDVIGRRPSIFSGLICFTIGSLICMQSQSQEWMLFGRLVQGFGVSGPRIVSVAIIRDRFIGRAMAQVMSFIMMVFIIVPMIAPAIGQVVVQLSNWRMIFAVFIALALIITVWFGWRHPETLPADKRKPFSWTALMRDTRTVLSTRSAMWFTAAAGFIFGGFLTYLSSAQAIYQELYDVGDQFPVYFAAMAFSIGVASYVNSRLVMRFGTRLISYLALYGFIGCFTLLWVLALLQDGLPPIWQFMLLGASGFFSVGLLFGNLNAMAMQPLGKVAGLGAALVGSLTSFISVPLSYLVGLFYNDTLIPLVAGFAIFGSASLYCTWRGLRGFAEE